MRVATPLLLTLTLAVAGGNAQPRFSEVDCEKTKQKISKIQSRMRQGYSVKAGEKMKDELRRLQKLRAKQCR